MQQQVPWILASISVALLLVALALTLLRRRRTPPSLPTEWTLTPRPVFSTDERRVYRQLREALPHHIVLSKLPLVRFCQPADPAEVRFWYELLGTIHVTFAICSANGRVLAAIDLDTERGSSRRRLQIKRSVLAACRVRYLRCPVDHLPSIPELQLLVPQTGSAARGPQPAPTLQARDGAGAAAISRQRERSALWQDSGFLQDSFFGVDARSDLAAPSAFGSLRGGGGAALREAPEAPKDAGGVVNDARPPPRHH
jgi:hypothetical protein